MYASRVPRLWDTTIEAHRHHVRDAILETTATLVAEQGLLSVTMSQIAASVGIGRATLYKYFPDIEAILDAWQERHISAHLAHLSTLRDQRGDPGGRLAAVLEAYAVMSHHRARHATPELAVLLHRGERVADTEAQLHALVRELLTSAAGAGHIRADVAPDELTAYCLHALAAASDLPSEDAVHRLVTVTLDGLRLPTRTG